MAIFTPGPAVAQVSGSIGGTTFSRNKGGQYMRNRAVPTNPNTALQQAVRENFATRVAEYSTTLTQIQRDGWIDYAQDNPILNALGQSILLTGQQWYIRLNTVLDQAGLTSVADAPPLGANPIPDEDFEITDAEEGPQALEFTWDITLPWQNEDGAALLVYQHIPVPASVKPGKGPYRLATSVLGSSTLAPTPAVEGAITSVWNISTGDRILLQARIVDAFGRHSSRFGTASFVVQ